MTLTVYCLPPHSPDNAVPGGPAPRRGPGRRAATDAQKRADAKYKRANVTNVTVGFYPDDADILELVRSQPSRAGYIKDLIRADLERRKASPAG